MTLKTLKYFMIIVGLVCTITSVDAQQNLGRLYAKVVTSDGDELEGRISWGQHETVWNNSFDASYKFYDYNRDSYYRQRDREDRNRPNSGLTAQFSVYFGDIRKLEARGSRAVIVLKDGREYEVFSGDVGESVHVDDKDLGRVKVAWRNLEEVQFMDEPDSYSRLAVDQAYPIYGKVLTRSDHTFRGFIIWDNDETLSTDILDGKDGRYDREIPFSKIKSIASRSRRSSRVVLVTGKEIVMSGTNDVDNSNKGLIIADKDYGIVSVDWEDVENVEFEHKVPGMKYSDFKTGSLLHGTVTDDRGKEFTGFIRWDDDEEQTSDFLNGESFGYDFKIPFASIKEIRRRTRKTAIVILRNGDELRMSGSNDVDSGNKGVVVFKDKDFKDGQLFSWDEFEKVVFDHK